MQVTPQAIGMATTTVCHIATYSGGAVGSVSYSDLTVVKYPGPFSMGKNVGIRINSLSIQINRLLPLIESKGLYDLAIINRQDEYSSGYFPPIGEVTLLDLYA